MRDLLDMLNVDARVSIAHLTLLISGVGDCLKVSLGRNREVNGAALSAVLRPCLEVTGQIVWLLDDQLSGRERARRYVIWLFSDLRAQRLLVRNVRHPEAARLARSRLDELEGHLIEQVEAAGWIAKPTTYRGDNVEPGALLTAVGKPEKMPGYMDLASFTPSTGAAYSLLSVAVHGNRFGVLNGLEMADEPNLAGSTTSTLKGFGLPTDSTIRMAGLALLTPVKLFAQWTGIECVAFTTSAQALFRATASGQV